ncbi:M61 family metallopeptidase [Shewanella waksmanii]|uniref:M61 family metallopeptidase n=1 Tax=Shewanella waksmanii TaxID=213783 RepID=UPI003736EB9D
MKLAAVLILFVTGLFSVNTRAQVSYHIDLTEPEHHLAQVTVSFPKADSEVLDINLPVWRTGKYQVLPLGDVIRYFTATDSQGQPLDWQRTASGQWRVQLPEPTAVTVNYQVYANKLGQRVSHINDSHAYLDASGVFVYSPSYRDEPLQVDLTVPSHWQSYSGMISGQQPHQFKALNYDVLVDSPIETGISQHRQFSADGRDYELVVWGEGNYNLDDMVKDLTALSGQANAIWSDYPLERYVYMVHATSGARGATEHLNSTVIQRPRFSFRERKDYLGFIKTASHEFIHTWNVKAYRPQGLVPYNYQQEGITELLWIAEGSTSYFQSQLLLRAGVITAKEFLVDLATRVESSLNTPGRAVQSIAQASANQWVSSGGDYAKNHSANIYSEGFIASWALDFSLIKDTKLQRSYRDVHQALYQQHRIPLGYSVEDVQAILQQVSGKDYQTWWQQHINQPLVLDYPKLLAQAGLAISYSDEEQQVDAGFTARSGSLVLEHVALHGPAWKAGIVHGDEIIAINGLRVTAKGLKQRLADFKAGDSIDVLLFSDDKLKRVSLPLGSKPKGDLKLVSVDNPSRAQKAFFKAWAGIDWPFDKNGEL